MIPTLTLTDFLGCKKLKLVNIKVKPSCNIHLILKFYYQYRTVSSAVLQKMGQWGKILMVRT